MSGGEWAELAIGGGGILGMMGACLRVAYQIGQMTAKLGQFIDMVEDHEDRLRVLEKRPKLPRPAR